jgi:hypothetical protein
VVRDKSRLEGILDVNIEISAAGAGAIIGVLRILRRRDNNYVET